MSGAGRLRRPGGVVERRGGSQARGRDGGKAELPLHVRGRWSNSNSGGGFGIGRVERGRLIEVAVPGARVTLSRPGADGEEPLSGRTNAEGDFLFCGIPFGATVTLTPDFPGTQGATETVELAGAVGAVRDLSLQMPDAGGLEGNPLEIRVERTGVGEPADAARVVGRVVDHADGDPVVGATIRLVEAEPVLTTDADGRFVFGNVAPGTYELEVEHVGYGTQRQTFEIEGGPVVELAVRIPSRPIALEGVTVDARRRTPAVEAARAAGTRPDVMTRVDIAPLEGVTQHVGQLARRFPGVRVAGDPGVGGSVCVGSTRAAPPTTGCVPAMLVLDDMRFDGAQGAEILASIPLQDIESFEFLHPMQALPRFGPRAGMGALVIYTRGRGPYAERQR